MNVMIRTKREAVYWNALVVAVGKDDLGDRTGG